MESEISLPCSQKPTSGLSPQPDASSPQISLFPSNLISIFHHTVLRTLFWFT